jgi:hypothetical protein
MNLSAFRSSAIHALIVTALLPIATPALALAAPGDQTAGGRRARERSGVAFARSIAGYHSRRGLENSMNETLPSPLEQAKQRIRGIWFNVVALIFGPALILIGVNALPPQWRPGLDWPIQGERATASVESIRLSLRHVEDDPHIDNFKASAQVVLAYKDRSGQLQRAALAGPWLLQEMTQRTGDAAWNYLADIATGIGVGAVDVDMPRDLAAQLATAHEEFKLGEYTASNLDRPLRWVAVSWMSPQQALVVRYDPKRPAIAIPEFLIERESTRLQGAGMLRALAFVAGCIFVGVLAWRVLSFPNRVLRAGAVLLVLGTVLQWSSYVSRMVRIVAPGIDAWTGLNIDEVAVDPLAPFYDPFRAGPHYAAVNDVPPLQGVAWTADQLSAHALTKWLRSVPVAIVHGSIEDAETALTQAAKRTLGDISDGELDAINADVTAIAARRYWPGGEHYVELRDAVRAEVDRRAK